MSAPYAVIPILLMLTGTAPAGDNPLRECDARAGSHTDVTRCLDAQRRDAEAVLAEAAAAMRHRMENLAETTGKLAPIVAFDAAQREFENFRALNCAWYYDLLKPATGAANAQTACLIRMTRARSRELQELLRGPDRQH